MTTLRSYLAIVLSLALVLTGGAMVQARMVNPATGLMVLCSGSGPIVMLVDAQGQPTSAPHLCPDCTLVVAALLTEQPVAAELVLGGSTLLSVATRTEAPTQHILRKNARAPPLII
ncbi:hypothetical protein KO498_17535 [Lentibacter algarum]|uniref:hypothetical protein n=1 Tax=Lentibacter algarum TaxID=576131 RepID=UPI001C08BB0A|nr:hypothetical protein [Lentibacter algarum]MBU2983614.1 hypothetical protein [Lentibacter algarum]